ncbi:MAG: TatD family hydrolase [Kiritimatiellae bacterium]|nr:TatD family hydrolase [Kiritimatiellia bacterium]
MLDAHCHNLEDPSWCRMGERLFIGTHPWHLDGFDEAELVRRLEADPGLGVGEIGLDRLKAREISPRMRQVFMRQLMIAAYFRRPVVLHGAKCWGEVTEACKPFKGQIPAFLFHGFSRSEGLLSGIIDLNGYISVGPAILNDHADNYRALVAKIQRERILAETDNEAGRNADIAAVYAKLKELYGITEKEILENYGRFRT